MRKNVKDRLMMPSNTSGVAPPDGAGVLVVDDEPAFAELTATVLERVDDEFDVETVPRANDGLERLASGDIDCVVSDYEMPGMDGLEFLTTVRETHPEMPFILFTGKGSEEIASEAISAGVTDYLQKKPGSHQFELLANQVANAVERTRAECALEKERERFITLFEQLPDPAAIAETRDGVPILLRVNPAFEVVFGYPAETAVGQSVDDLIVPPGHEAEAKRLDRRLGKNQQVDVELQRQTATGELREFLFRNVPIKFDSGRTSFGIYIDITERKRHKREGERLNKR